MDEEQISSIALMERAATCFVEALYKKVDLHSFSDITIFCGPGNNGGDGLVIARLLAQQKHTVHTVICIEDKTTEEHNINLERLQQLTLSNLSITKYNADSRYAFNPKSLIIDALFGIGLSKPLTGYFADVVGSINQSGVMVVAVDVPSGLHPDRHTPKEYPVVHALLTLTFQFQKLAYLLPENEQRMGEVVIVDIGLMSPKEKEATYHLIHGNIIAKLLKPISRFAHKGSHGHGLLIAGSAEMPGAALLAAQSALRGGIGKLTVHLPKQIAYLLPITTPEAILSVDTNDLHFSDIDLEKHPTINTIAIGPGIGQHKATKAALSNLLDMVASPIIIDADALNILSENKTWLSFLPAHSILTPHIKEFERLAGTADNDFDRLQKLSDFAKRYTLIVILKGAYTAVAMPDGKMFFNTTGNPGMATAGSGDVLTGLLLALLSKGYSPEIAALLGVYIHGLAGDLAVQDCESFESLVAGDICRYFGRAYMATRI